MPWHVEHGFLVFIAKAKAVNVITRTIQCDHRIHFQNIAAIGVGLEHMNVFEPVADLTRDQPDIGPNIDEKIRMAMFSGMLDQARNDRFVHSIDQRPGRDKVPAPEKKIGAFARETLKQSVAQIFRHNAHARLSVSKVR